MVLFQKASINIIFKSLIFRGVYFTFPNRTLDLNIVFDRDIDISCSTIYMFIYKFISHRYRQDIAKM